MTPATSAPPASWARACSTVGGVLGVVEPPVVGVEHDAGGQAALAREPVVQDVGGVLGLDAGHAFAVVELAAGAALQGHDGDGGHEPEAEHPERVPGAGAAEAVQECAHGILLGWAPPPAGTTCTIQERADLCAAPALNVPGQASERAGGETPSRGPG